VLGQTQDGLFQLGVSKTINASAAVVWKCLQSQRGISLITSAASVGAGDHRDGDASTPVGMDSLESLDGESPSGIKVSTTTFEAGSHVRLRWQRPYWQAHSILQIRVTARSDTKTTLTFHQEKLPSLADRGELREHWQRVARLIAEMTTTGMTTSDMTTTDR